MDLNKALNILEIDKSVFLSHTLTESYIKKKYHSLALKHHPDKNNNTPESNEKFKELQDSYHFLLKEINNSFIYNNDTNHDYNYLLKLFIKMFINDLNNEHIINNILCDCVKISLKLFENLDRDNCLKIYCFLSKHHKILHISNTTLNEIREIVQYKYQNVEIYELNPTITDLIHNNIYKLVVNDQICYVPLWIKESYFDISGCEIIVLCNPQLPEHIQIDDNNNIFITTEIVLNTDFIKLIIESSDILVMIGEEKVFVPITELYMKKNQSYIIKNKGLVKSCDLANDDYIDIYNVHDRADIIINFILC
jgi:hypothetical protein